LIDVAFFHNCLQKNGASFFTGVPDSLLSNICAYIQDYAVDNNHVIASNEGNAIALAMGRQMASAGLPVVYMQNSGLGNCINPLLSLADKEVYSIPLVLMIGWRGQPGILDEPQHIVQGRLTENLLKEIGIPYKIISPDIAQQDVEKIVTSTFEAAKNNSSPQALLVCKGSFTPYRSKEIVKESGLASREEFIQVLAEGFDEKDIVVATTGVLSRELFECRKNKRAGHYRDFLTIGGMGHASQIALGIALEKPSRRVICLDGDGAFLMHAGGPALIGAITPSNFRHIVINNGVHDSVGGQSISTPSLCFTELAESMGYKKILSLSKCSELENKLQHFLNCSTLGFMEIKTRPGYREDLSRPDITPIENKKEFINFVND
jgi:phosphonopyruvate decarboxylase